MHFSNYGQSILHSARNNQYNHQRRATARVPACSEMSGKQTECPIIMHLFDEWGREREWAAGAAFQLPVCCANKFRCEKFVSMETGAHRHLFAAAIYSIRRTVSVPRFWSPKIAASVSIFCWEIYKLRCLLLHIAFYLNLQFLCWTNKMFRAKISKIRSEERNRWSKRDDKVVACCWCMHYVDIVL